MLVTRYQVIEKIAVATIILMAIVLLFGFMSKIFDNTKNTINKLNKNKIEIEQLE